VNITLSGAEKRALKSRAQTLDAVVRVGQAGLSEPMVASMEEALELHELVKVRFVGLKEERRTLAPELAERTSSLLVQTVGNVAVYFRPSASASQPEAEAS
jgi:RNA-binding protein